MTVLAVLPLLFSVTSGMHAQTMTTPAPIAKAQQMFVVDTPNWDAVDGKLQRYVRSSSSQSWQKVGDEIPIVVGKHGLGWGRGLLEPKDVTGPQKKEGDGRSPAGVFALGTAFGYAPQKLSGSMLPYLELSPSIECVDDVASQHYNRIVDRSAISVDWNSSEHMRDTGEPYRWGIVVDFNGIAAQPSSQKTNAGGGSCIFLHIWEGSGHGTAGCTAMAEPQLEDLLRWIDPRKNPVLVQLPAEDYKRLQKDWQLPTR
jgi:L,D-peptidoglycan transpeptidase YkuD (ErfK/YbiS/YcfS/YnhG family)